jgi:sugar O-acyltransferase (sialic acid O-acetyltransferase NeuD family)
VSGLLVIGAGGHGVVVADAAAEGGRWDRIAFLDDRFPEWKPDAPWGLLGGLDAAAALRDDYPDLVVAVGDNAARLGLTATFQAQGFRLPPVVHPTAWVSRLAALGPGSVVLAHAAVGPRTRTGTGCIVNTGATVDHDCALSDGVHISPGAHLGGGVTVGARTWIGIGAAVRHGIRVGADVTVGAGAAVVDDLADGVTAVGVPAR